MDDLWLGACVLLCAFVGYTRGYRAGREHGEDIGMARVLKQWAAAEEGRRLKESVDETLQGTS